MRRLSTDEANTRLSSIGMRIGDWNRLVPTGARGLRALHMRNYKGPSDARGLLNFSRYIAGWLPKGDWKLLQIDNSTSLNVADAYWMRTLLCSAQASNEPINGTYIFDFGNGVLADQRMELLISNLIYAFLLFECHGCIVSSSYERYESLALQDGYAYFSSTTEGQSNAHSLIQEFERRPSISPPWIMDIVASGQLEAP